MKLPHFKVFQSSQRASIMQIRTSQSGTRTWDVDVVCREAGQKKCEHAIPSARTMLSHKQSNCQSLINKWSREQHPQPWNGNCGLALGKKLLMESSSHFASWLVKLSRVQVKQVIALINRHGYFKKHLHSLGSRNDIQECRLFNQFMHSAKQIIFNCETDENIFVVLKPGKSANSLINSAYIGTTWCYLQ